MKKLLKHISFLIFLINAGSVFSQGSGPLYLLDFTDPSTFTYDCGKVNPPLWEVSNDSCTLETSYFSLPDNCGTLSDVPFRITLNQSGNLECNDKAYFWYYCDTAWFPLDTIDGCLTTYVIDFYYFVPCPAGSTFAIKVSFHTNHNTEKWQLRNNDIEVGNPCPTVLDNNFITLNGRHTEKGNLLEWKGQKNSDILYILQRSTDQIHFEDITSIEGIDEDDMLFGYFDDVDDNRTYYYRLKIIDSNKDVFSPIVKIDAPSENKFFNIFPNPSKGRFNISIPSAEKSVVMLNILDLNGQIVAVQEVIIEKGDNNVEVDLTGKAPGLYYITIQNDLHKQNAIISITN